ncbi:fibrillin-2 isoform X1 [Cephus cinctus]|uniref:Fibrillin-2 isoform X1 n=1 Tax=Cephus cinctus TaxID=211228 RepID=A0AAJ7RL81_CEPCN|nr:fibrillin-2 isoform X1 [Cephus cinctus]XP_024942999.1 fibrillin-2 isoform X1 [Cephus cinctus]
MMAQHYSITVIALVVVLHLEQGVESRMESQFEKCCGLGSSWALQELRCESFVGPVTGVPQVEQGLCLEAVDICCVRAYREKQCQLGKSNARAGKACRTDSKNVSDYQRDCCEGCKLGILTGSMGQGCTFKKFSFGKPWDPAFLECCYEAAPSTTIDSTNGTTTVYTSSTSGTSSVTSRSTSATTDSLSTSTTPLMIPPPPFDDICQLMKGMLCSDICIPTVGSFTCACREGFTLLEDGKTCRQDIPVDRCKTDNPCEQKCTDTGDTVICSCEPGYVLAMDKHSCDLETTTTNAVEAENNLSPLCPFGYQYNAVSQVCDDIDECQKNVCPGRCENTIGSFVCLTGSSTEKLQHEVCPPGYRYESAIQRCADIDECTELPDACNKETQLCVNIQGNFTCHDLTSGKSCPAGFKFDAITKTCKDVDECTEGIHGCLPEIEACRNIDGAYECDIKCQGGFIFSVNLGACIDVDECAVNATELCPGSECINTVGGYECSKQERPSTKSQCPAGYKPTTNPTEPCTDVNECNEQLHSCDSTERCVNEIGSYRCDPLYFRVENEFDNLSDTYNSHYKGTMEIEPTTSNEEDQNVSAVRPMCLPGYTYNYSTERCDDIDECQTINNNCTGQYMQCTNIPGTFHCDCRNGFELNLSTLKCQDIDECARGLMTCSAGERCVNSIGAHQCSPACPPGLQPDPLDETICRDIDECKLGIHSCPAQTHVCVNTNGSYVCDVVTPCRNGYIRDKVSGECVDIDECQDGPGCREHEHCQNLPGSYDCSPLCGPGWLFNTRTKSCQDVDECLLGQHNCPQGTHTCSNTNGSFTCVAIPPCENGFRRAFDGSCQDVDECVENVHNCLLANHQYCVNREGSFECITRLPACDKGYEYSLSLRRCEDIDECTSGKFKCDSRLGERCINLPGSYKCERPHRVFSQQQPACPTGYKYHTGQRQCFDIDECKTDAHICGSEVCYNQPGGYSCAKAPVPAARKPNNRCAAGTRYTRNGCMDIDECKEIEDACSSDEKCINTVGSFYCSCKIGFRRDNLTQACVDINECQLPENECLPSQRCDNTLGSYTCTRFLPCGTGYTLNVATQICEDDDECILGTHDCSEGYHCRNTLGSYRCHRNTRVSQSTPARPYGPFTTTATTTKEPVLWRPPSVAPRSPITCPSGYQISSRQCVDIDECQQAQNLCGALRRCINTVGSYHCVSRIICGNGYQADSSGFHCVDIDECADGSHDCGQGQTCENRQGGYLCSCPPGHTIGPNKDCVDIDECSIYGGSICSANGQCENTIGSYRCNCKEGFESYGANSCRDVDECRQTPGLCQHLCINVWGSYKCTCRSGFRLNLDNRSCSDVDECTEFKQNNICAGICENTPGSYACKCPNGYRLGQDERSCQDINECDAGNVCRSPAEICQNIRGSYRCNKIVCPSGYYRDNERQNRCIRRSHYCQSGDEVCFRLPSHYSYNFLSFVSMMPIPPTGQLELFTMRSNHLPGSVLQFSMTLVDVRAPPGVVRATESCFRLRKPSLSQVILVLTQSVQGPQEIELDLSMEIYHNTIFAGSAVAKLLIVISQYEF